MQKHRVTTSTAAVVDEPTSLQLAALVAEVDRSGRGAFVVIERRSDPVRVTSPAGENSLEARNEGGDWVLEMHAGGPDRHYRSTVSEPALAFAALASWMKGTENWRTLRWEKLGGRPSWQGPPSGDLARAV